MSPLPFFGTLAGKSKHSALPLNKGKLSVPLHVVAPCPVRMLYRIHKGTRFLVRFRGGYMQFVVAALHPCLAAVFIPDLGILQPLIKIIRQVGGLSGKRSRICISPAEVEITRESRNSRRRITRDHLQLFSDSNLRITVCYSRSALAEFIPDIDVQ